MSDAQLSEEDASGRRLALMATQSSMIALDKTLAILRRSERSYKAATIRCYSLAERMTRAAGDVYACLDRKYKLVK